MSAIALRKQNLITAALVAVVLFAPALVSGVTPDSPEVKALLDKAFKYLETANDGRLGGRCLIGLCFVKRGEHESHPQVQAAVDACRAAMAANPTGKQVGNEYVYSIGLAIVFLCELNPSKYQAEIHYFLTSLQSVQRLYGGWGYPLDHPQWSKSADTSMTQYGVLASWEAKRHGFVVPIDSIERVCGWLMRTQDPSGGWGYQGKDSDPNESGGFPLRKQSDVRQGLSAAGLGSVLICGDLLGLSTLPKYDEEDGNLPPALKPVQDEPDQKPLTQKITARALRQTQRRGLGWWSGNYKIDVPNFPLYYLYALERFRSFHELATGQHPREPGWYNDGYRYLKRKQKDDGSWDGGAGPAPDTSFGILFLMRSTKKSIEKTKGYDAGTLAGGQGLPRKISDARLREGRIVDKPVSGSVPALLDILAHPDHPDFADLADDPENIAAGLADEQGAARDEHLAAVRRLATQGPSASRRGAVRVLAKLREMSNVPTLIAALADSDWKVVYLADQALRSISRRVGIQTIIELPDETARKAAIAYWKQWYAESHPGETTMP
jgi:hypothetical protein